jgi:hypothetical protein
MEIRFSYVIAVAGGARAETERVESDVELGAKRMCACVMMWTTAGRHQPVRRFTDY